MSQELTGKVAIITGASKGIGAGIAKAMADAGAKVVLSYSSSKEAADQVVASITAKGGNATAIRSDITQKKDVEHLFAEAKKLFGKLDILVNNAGVYEFSALENITEEHFHKQFNTNVLGLLLAAQQAVKNFEPSGGCIINISSVASKDAVATASVYSATKAAVDAITKALSKELGPRHIRVNAINPGMVETEGTRAIGVLESDFRKEVESRTPLGRIGQPQDIAPVAVLLASSAADWITGETIRVSGGLY